MNLPQPIKEFAQKYYIANDRATVMPNYGLQFQKKDRKELARECKFLLESGGVENLHQLAMDLHSVRPDLTPGAHRGRLERFAKQCNIKFGKAPKEARQVRVVAPVAVTLPSLAPKSIRAELSMSFQKWLSQGMSLNTIQAEAQEVLLDVNGKVQEARATSTLQELIRTTGMTPSQISQLADRL